MGRAVLSTRDVHATVCNNVHSQLVLAPLLPTLSPRHLPTTSQACDLVLTPVFDAASRRWARPAAWTNFWEQYAAAAWQVNVGLGVVP